MTMNQLKSILAAAAIYIVASVPVFAQFPTNDEGFVNPLPETGMWYPNDGSGTGIILEVQAGTMVGALFGADASGDNTWLLFSGELVPRIDEDGFQLGWLLDTTLFRTTGSACIVDCPPGENPGSPVTTEAGRIELEFSSRNVATFRIDDGVAKPIAPFYFGVLARRTRPNSALGAMPDLTGTWVYISDVLNRTGSQIADGRGVVRIGPPTVSRVPTAEGGHVLEKIVFPVEFAPGNTDELICEFEQGEDPADSYPRCSLVPGFGVMSPSTVFLADLTDSRFIMSSAVGDVVGDVMRTDFFRVAYD